MKAPASEQLILALDFGTLPEAIRCLRKLKGRLLLVKIGSQLFTSVGPAGIGKIVPLVSGIFLDLKFCDIPNTVSKAVAAAAAFPKIRMLTIHATGGLEMMRSAKASLAGVKNPPKLLAVTVLTSLNESRIREIGLAGPISLRVQELARLAKTAGMDGIVASPQELLALRRIVGKDMLLVAPGVRPRVGAAQSVADDQARIATPGEAIAWGADYLVVGRPITEAADPAKAADAILKEMAEAKKSLAQNPQVNSASNAT